MCVTPQCDLIPAAQNLYLGLNFLVAEFGECEEGMLGSGDGTRRDACTANGDGEDELLGSRDGDDVALRGHMLVGEGCAEGPSLFALSWRGGGRAKAQEVRVCCTLCGRCKPYPAIPPVFPCDTCERVLRLRRRGPRSNKLPVTNLGLSF